MDIFLYIVAGILLLLSFAGNILPGLPGTPLGYIGLLLMQFTDKSFSTTFLVIMGVIVVLVQVLDYVVPIWGAKQFGATKHGVWGSTIGLILGLIIGLWAGFWTSLLGIILGPFIGAVVGELIKGQKKQDAFKAGLGTFIGFIFSTGIKMVCSGFMIFFYIRALIA